ncbi:Calreticulin [Intoshia linei]|uniref:Calreticulin n=1 Tax=Intoshia linei TaxID=1819745 RepID=A0A177B7X7_9BILA|nr:Calreticulin [Intoshia linei]
MFIKFKSLIFTLCLSLITRSMSKIFFQEQFKDMDNWVSSESGDNLGTFSLNHNKYTQDTSDFELTTVGDAKFFRLSAKFDESINNLENDLVVHYSVAHPQEIDCGGGYLKIMSSDTDQKSINGDSPYGIMFGPDICGGETKKVHLIINYNDKNHLIKHNIPCPHDTFTHSYTLVLSPLHRYKVLVDGELMKEGNIEDDFDVLPSKMIKDPSVSKPDDWVDDEMIDDVTDEKPDDWDQPEKIPDPEATKPEDWDDDDPEWEPPMIENGEWKAKKIKNPDYKGPWVHPEIDNPEYVFDDSLGRFKDLGVAAIEIWQVKSGSRFDSIIISNDEIDAEDHIAVANEKRAAEKKIYDEEKAKEEAERKAAEKDKPKESDDSEDVDDIPSDDDSQTQELEDDVLDGDSEENDKDEL